MRYVVLVELAAALLALATVVVWPGRDAGWLRSVDRPLARLARRRALSILLVGALAFGGSALVGLLRGLPVPAVHDEFSYLLAADTFAHGRLTNPPHPHWVHFETVHVLQQPTYASKYPPAPGLALALGQALGYPVLGVWLALALACAALTWALQAWVPPRWALLGGLLAALRLGLFSYWAQSYWGGAVPALGGALLFGALRRLLPTPRPRDAVWLGLGLALLASSRPYEGLLLGLVAAAVLLRGLLGRAAPPWRVTLPRLLLPLGLVLALTAGALAYYNFRVTGSPLTLPYQVHEATYGLAPAFLWQPLRPVPSYRHAVLREYHEGKARKFIRQQSVTGLIAVKARQFGATWGFYLGPLLTLPLVMLPWALKDRWIRVAFLSCGVVVAGMSVVSWMNPHYAAPITAVLYALVLGCMRHLRVWRWRGRATGRLLVWIILVFWVAVAPHVRVAPRASSRAASQQRTAMLAQLEARGGRHVVLVRYWPLHHHWHWVYNRADIDAATTVWVHEMDAASNRELLAYFKDRRIWLLEADARPPRLVPYPTDTKQSVEK